MDFAFVSDAPAGMIFSANRVCGHYRKYDVTLEPRPVHVACWSHRRVILWTTRAHRARARFFPLLPEHPDVRGQGGEPDANQLR